MYGGAGFGDGGASQFAGAGFMPSQGNAGAAAGSAKKDYGSKNQTLRAFTVKQLADNTSNLLDDSVMIDGKEVSNFTVVGKVVHVEETNLMYIFRVDDGTGVMPIKFWINSPEGQDDGVRARMSEIQPGTHIRAHGHFQSFDQNRAMVAFNVRPITDYNEVTYHYLQAIFQHLHNTKGMQPAAPAAAGYGAPAPGGYGAPPAYGGAAPAPAAGGVGYAAGGLSAIQQEVLAVFNQPDALGEVGLSINDAVARFGGKFSYVQVREAVEVLQNEGHLYSTIDEQHFKSCTA